MFFRGLISERNPEYWRVSVLSNIGLHNVITLYGCFCEQVDYGKRGEGGREYLVTIAAICGKSICIFWVVASIDLRRLRLWIRPAPNVY